MKVNWKEWARQHRVHPVTAYRWFREGKLPVPARRPGRLILVDQAPVSAVPEITVVYARVSSTDQRADLDRQVARVTAWAAAQSLAVGRVVTEVGSALNGKRRKLLALLRDKTATTIVGSTATGSPASVPSTWRPPYPHKDVGCWWWTPARWTTIWSGM